MKEKFFKAAEALIEIIAEIDLDPNNEFFKNFEDEEFARKLLASVEEDLEYLQILVEYSIT